MKQFWAVVKNGIFQQNPTFSLVLGMCPTLAVTTSALNGLGMGLATLFVLVCSNVLISALRKLIPSEIRIPVFIVIIASFVTVVSMLMEAYVTTLYDALGLYIPLIVVNCIILGRAEAFAAKNPVGLSFADGLGMGLGFTLSLFTIGTVREIIGAGTFLGHTLVAGYEPMLVAILPPGAFLILGLLMAGVKQIALKRETKR